PSSPLFPYTTLFRSRRLLADGHDLVFLRGVVGVEFVFRSDTLAADDQGELFADLCGDRAQRLLHRRAARIGRKIGEWFVAKLRRSEEHTSELQSRFD